MNSSIKQTKKNEHGKLLSARFKAARISVNKVREIKSREFKAVRKMSTTRILIQVR